ncbi:MAG TPA: UvrD-helicase domain-containing protein [Pirellulaceae bacterium]|nr:UvrD-helicase domain-containing protein [Pirellulaceae bacterium]HMO91858.1 UvrD-helicase domain-containing protein [Pirellulaceae bacterium]HMP69732.1 UvrD-helicase domain-containing protein [Pirellulaceae bacterium]
MSTLTKNLLIRASAGTGKTYQLSSRFIQLLSAGTQPHEILATTFTRKAAGEILDRVFERLAMASLDDNFASNTAGAIEIALERPRDFFGSQLQNLIAALHQLQISTLDSFFAQLARAFSVEVGLRHDWRIVDEAELNSLITEAIRVALDHVDAKEFVYLLNKGETAIGIARMVRTTIDDLHEVYLDALPAAWTRIPDEAPTPGAWQTLSEQLSELAPHASHAGLTKRMRNDSERLLEGDWKKVFDGKLIESILDGEPKYYGKPPAPEIIAAYQEFITQARMALFAELNMQNHGAYALLQTYDQAYQQLELERSSLTFSSVTRRVSTLTSLLTPHEVNLRLDQNIKHLLLDEFQDTSLEQWRVLQPFALESINSSDEGSLFCVGDTKQAIYGWRGGVAEVFDEVESLLTDPQELSELTVSRRSSPVVIDAVNQIFHKLSNISEPSDATPFIERWQQRFSNHTSYAPEMPGYVAIEALEPNESCTLLECAANRILELVERHPGKSFGVLARRNAVVNQLVILLRHRGVQASEEGGNSLLDSAAVNLVYSLLHLIDYPGDEAARFHVAHSYLGQKLGLRPATYEAERLARRGEVRSDTSEKTGSLFGSLDRESAWIEEFCQSARQRIGRLGLAVVIEGWAELIFEYCTLRERTRLNQLIDMAYAFEKLDQPLKTFRRQLEAFRIDDPLGSDVRVMTIHQAKGLEFDVVVLPELGYPLIRTRQGFISGRDGATEPISCICRYVNKDHRRLLPETLQQAHEQHLQAEVFGELCLMYVALTRAKHAMHLLVEDDFKLEHKTWQGVITNALQVGASAAENSVLWSLGDIDWDSTSFDRKDSPGDIESLVGPSPYRDWSYLNQVRLATPQSVSRMIPLSSPSRREGVRMIELGSTLRSVENMEAMMFGTLIHACFELVDWLDARVPDERELDERLSTILGAAPSQLAEAKHKFFSYIQLPNISRLLSKRRFTDDRPTLDLQDGVGELVVENERAFAVLQGDSLLQGFIDRLVLYQLDGEVRFVEVIDFKTDRFDKHNSAGLSERVEWYLPQMESYRFAAAEVFGLGLEQVAVRLAFVEADQVVKVF